MAEEWAVVPRWQRGHNHGAGLGDGLPEQVARRADYMRFALSAVSAALLLLLCSSVEEGAHLARRGEAELEAPHHAVEGGGLARGGQGEEERGGDGWVAEEQPGEETHTRELPA